MAFWKHTEIVIDGQPEKAQAPIILLTSRSVELENHRCKGEFGQSKNVYWHSDYLTRFSADK